MTVVEGTRLGPQFFRPSCDHEWLLQSSSIIVVVLVAMISSSHAIINIHDAVVMLMS